MGIPIGIFLAFSGPKMGLNGAHFPRSFSRPARDR